MKTVILRTGTEKLCFKTKEELSVGDKLKSKDYIGTLEVIHIDNHEYSYVNDVTGDLTDTFNSIHCLPIEQLNLRYDSEDMHYFQKL